MHVFSGEQTKPHKSGDGTRTAKLCQTAFLRGAKKKRAVAADERARQGPRTHIPYLQCRICAWFLFGLRLSRDWCVGADISAFCFVSALMKVGGGPKKKKKNPWNDTPTGRRDVSLHLPARNRGENNRAWVKTGCGYELWDASLLIRIVRRCMTSSARDPLAVYDRPIQNQSKLFNQI